MADLSRAASGTKTGLGYINDVSAHHHFGHLGVNGLNLLTGLFAQVGTSRMQDNASFGDLNGTVSSITNGVVATSQKAEEVYSQLMGAHAIQTNNINNMDDQMTTQAVQSSKTGYICKAAAGVIGFGTGAFAIYNQVSSLDPNQRRILLIITVVGIALFLGVLSLLGIRGCCNRVINNRRERWAHEAQEDENNAKAVMFTYACLNACELALRNGLEGLREEDGKPRILVFQETLEALTEQYLSLDQEHLPKEMGIWFGQLIRLAKQEASLRTISDPNAPTLFDQFKLLFGISEKKPTRYDGDDELEFQGRKNESIDDDEESEKKALNRHGKKVTVNGLYDYNIVCIIHYIAEVASKIDLYLKSVQQPAIPIDPSNFSDSENLIDNDNHIDLTNNNNNNNDE